MKTRMSQITKSVQAGFTLIELMIVVAIIGILASVAIPQYQNYTQNASATTVIAEAKPYQTAVEVCALTNALVDCDAGSNGIPSITNGSVTDGVVTINAGEPFGTGTFILTPTKAANGQMTWAKSHTADATAVDISKTQAYAEFP